MAIVVEGQWSNLHQSPSIVFRGHKEEAVTFEQEIGWEGSEKSLAVDS